MKRLVEVVKAMCADSLIVVVVEVVAVEVAVGLVGKAKLDYKAKLVQVLLC